MVLLTVQVSSYIITRGIFLHTITGSETVSHRHSKASYVISPAPAAIETPPAPIRNCLARLRLWPGAGGAWSGRARVLR